MARTDAQLGAAADFGPSRTIITFTFLAWAEAAELGTLDGTNPMSRMCAALVFAILAVPALAGTVVPRKCVRQRLNPVFAAYAGVVKAETEHTAQRLDAALDKLLNDKSRIGDEALAVLLGFYLGEHSGEDISCELVHRGHKVLRFLKTYEKATIKLPEAPREALRPNQSEYRVVIERIGAGEHCTREP